MVIIRSPRFRAILLALFVTFLWSTSWVLIKVALAEIPPLLFAGLRYTLAFLVLLPGLWRHRSEVRALSTRNWGHLAILGVVFYTMTQGGQFVTLKHLDAITFSLLFNFTTLLVAVFGIFILREYPSRLQWVGILIFLIGVLVYFIPLSTTAGQGLGFLLAGFTVCANAAAALLGRSVNRHKITSPLVVTAISMGIGAFILLSVGLISQGFPHIGSASWFIIVWLAVVNTALAFTFWNHSLQVLSAVESSIINNTMLVQIAVLAWVFLGERLTLRDVMGLVLVMGGSVIAQLKRIYP